MSSDERIEIVLLAKGAPWSWDGRNQDEEMQGQFGTVEASLSCNARWFPKDDEEVGTETTREADTPQKVIDWISEFDAGRSADISIVWEVTALVSLNWGPL